MSPRDRTVEALRGEPDTLAVVERLLAEDVQWHGPYPGGGCRSREQVVATLRDQVRQGIEVRLRDARRAGDGALVGLELLRDEEPARALWFVLRLDGEGRIVAMDEYSSPATAEHDVALRADADSVAPPSEPVSGLVPFVQVADVERSLDFYRLLGFEVRETHEPDGRLEWCFLEREAARLMLARAGDPIDHRAQAGLLYLYTHDLVGLRDHLVARDVSVGEIVDGTPGPRRQMRVTDPDGCSLMVVQIDDETIVGPHSAGRALDAGAQPRPTEAAPQPEAGAPAASS